MFFFGLHIIISSIIIIICSMHVLLNKLLLCHISFCSAEKVRTLCLKRSCLSNSFVHFIVTLLSDGGRKV